MSFSGQLDIEKELKVTGFRAAGLSVKVCSFFLIYIPELANDLTMVGILQDCIVFSITPLDMSKSAFNDLRAVIPVCLATDAWSSVEL